MSARAPLARWGVLLSAGALYLFRHASVVSRPPAGEWRAPWPFLIAPHGGPWPWLVFGGALAGGIAVARWLQGPPFGVRLLLGTYAALVVPAHLLEVAGWALGRATFRPAWWAGAEWLAAVIAVLWTRHATPPPSAPDMGAGPSSIEASPRAIAAPAGGFWPGFAAAAAVVAALHVHSLARTIHHGARAWDGESYHLPIPLLWLHEGSLTEPLLRLLPFGVWGFEKLANPGNGHLLMAVPLLAGWDRLACLVQWPFLVAAAWAVLALARAAGASGPASAWASLAFLSAPIVAEQAAVPMHDLLTAALSLTALAILLGFSDQAEPPPPRVLATAALACGLALGTKITALAHLVLVATVLAGSRWLRAGLSARGRRALAVAVVAALVPSAFWYVRSARVFGNPVHPLRLVPFTEGMSAEDMSGRWDLDRMGMGSRREWLSFPFRDPEYSDETGFGALLVSFAALGLLAAGVDAAGALRERGLSPERRLAVLLLAAVVVFWLLAARTPRFNLPLLGIAAAAAAPALDGLRDRPRFPRLAALGLLLASATLALSLRYHGLDLGPPEPRAADLEDDWPGIPAGLDELPAGLLYNDTAAAYAAQASTYKLFGADHRHLVYDHPGVAAEAATGDEYVDRLRRLGARYVFLKLPRAEAPPARYQTPALRPLLEYKGREYRSVVFRVD